MAQRNSFKGIIVRKFLLTFFLIAVLGCHEEITNPQPDLPVTSNGISEETHVVGDALSPNTTFGEKNEIASTLEVIHPSDLEGITLQFWHVWFGEQGDLLQSLIDEFNLKNDFGIQVVSHYKGNYNELYKDIDEAIISKELPDISIGYIYQILTWQSLGNVVVDLTPYYNDSKWGLTQEERFDFYPIFWVQDLVNGVHLGFPAQRFTQVMVYNRTWARELGFGTPPYTPTEFKIQVCAAAQANLSDNDLQNDGTGGWAINTSPAAILSWFYAFGSQIIQPSKAGYLFNTSTSQNALSFLKDLKDSGCAWQANDPYVETEFATRRALIITASIADLPYIEKALDLSGSMDEWTIFAFPSPIDQPTIVVYGPSFVVFESTPKRQMAAWLFVRWLLLPENQARWIEVGSTLPIRKSTTQFLSEYASIHPQWSAVFNLLPFAQVEPSFPSWSVVRWAVSDVGTQIFRPYFTADRIPATLALLDETAAELDASFQK